MSRDLASAFMRSDANYAAAKVLHFEMRTGGQRLPVARSERRVGELQEGDEIGHS